MLKAAIIDDGVTRKLSNNLTFTSKGVKQISDMDSRRDRRSHSDKCLHIIEHYLPNEKSQKVSWHNIKILDDLNLRANADNFIQALEFCLEMQIKLIHLSIGSSCFSDFERIEAIIAELINRNTIIIAATNNRGTITYPACLPNVFGVKNNPLYRNNQFSVCEAPYDGISFIASATHDIDKIRISKSNSFAAPLITSLALNYLVDNTDANIRDVRKSLEDCSCTISSQNFNQFNGSNPTGELSGPIVVFTGFSENELLSILSELYRQFCDSGYYVRVLADAFDFHSLKFSRVPKIDEIDAYLDYMAYYFQCDILLAGITKSGYTIQETDNQFYVIKNDIDNSEFILGKSKLYWMPNSIESLFEKLESILS